MTPPGYRKIAVGSALSPRFLPLLAEANAIRKRFGGELHVIHASAEGRGKKDVFEEAFRELNLQNQVHLHIAEGGPIAVISRLTTEKKIDLLILGALDREASGRHFLGNVARNMIRAAKCSVLFLVQPELKVTRFQRIVVICDYSPLALEALRQAIFFAEQEPGCTVEVLRVLTIFEQIRKQGVTVNRKEELAKEEARLADFVESAGETDVEVTINCLECTTGFAVCDYVTSSHTDLLALPVSSSESGRLLPCGMDWLESRIPTNVFLIREPVKR